MSEGFAFHVVGDASKASNSIEGVLDQLDRVEAEARKAGQAITAGFSAGRGAVDKIAADAKKAAEANTTMAQRVNAVADQLAREQSMLERINRPLREYMGNLKALDSLLHSNEISTAQYAEQVARLNRQIDGAPKAAARGAVPTAAAAGPSMGSMLRTGAAAVGVGLGVSEIGQMANEYQTLQNRLRYIANGDQSKVNELFAETQRIAKATRSDLSSTTEGFVRMSLATKEMGLSQSDTLAFTARLNKAIKLSGASGAEASAGMIQLSQGLASGALRGDELRSVMESLPAVADVIAKSMGVTRGELRTMGAEGKITAEVVVEAFRKAGPDLDKAFGNTLPTISDSMTAFKNEVLVTAGEFVKSTGLAQGLGLALNSIGTAAQIITAPFKLLHDLLDGINDTLAALVTGAAAAGTALAIAVKSGAIGATGMGRLKNVAKAGLVAATVEGGMFAAEKFTDWASDVTGFNERLEATRALTKANNEYADELNKTSKEIIENANAVHLITLRHVTFEEQLKRSGGTLRDALNTYDLTKISVETFTDVINVAAMALANQESATNAAKAALADFGKPLADATEKAKVLSDAVNLIRADLAKMAGSKFSGVDLLDSGQVATVLASADAAEEARLRLQPYGEAVLKARKAETDRRREIEALTMAFEDLEMDEVEYEAAIDRLLPKQEKSAKATKKQTDEWKQLREALLGTVSAQQRLHFDAASENTDAFTRAILRSKKALDETAQAIDNYATRKRIAAAISADQAERDRNEAEVSFVGQMDHKTSFDALALYRAELKQLDDINQRIPMSQDLVDRSLADINKRYLESVNVLELLKPKYHETTEALRKIKEALSVGAITSDEYAAAYQKIWLGSEQYKEQQERFEQMTKSWHDRIEQMRADSTAFASSFAPIGDAIKEAFAQGEMSAKSLDQTLRSVAFNMFKFMAIKAAMSFDGAGGGGFLSTIANGIFGMAHGGVIYEGNGGTDSQLLAIRKSPNERVTVETPEDIKNGTYFRGGGGGATSLHVHVKNDEREITSAFRGVAGRQAVATINRKFRGRGT